MALHELKLKQIGDLGFRSDLEHTLNEAIVSYFERVIIEYDLPDPNEYQGNFCRIAVAGPVVFTSDPALSSASYKMISFQKFPLVIGDGKRYVFWERIK